MNFQYTPELQAYIQGHNKRTLAVELVEVNNSDFEITELHVHFIDDRMRTLFLEKKGYRSIPTDFGEVLLPRFPLEIAETVTFGLRSILFFKQVTYEGIRV